MANDDTIEVIREGTGRVVIPRSQLGMYQSRGYAVASEPRDPQPKPWPVLPLEPEPPAASRDPDEHMRPW